MSRCEFSHVWTSLVAFGESCDRESVQTLFSTSTVYNVALHGTCFYPHHSHHCTYPKGLGTGGRIWTKQETSRVCRASELFVSLSFGKRHQNYWLCGLPKRVRQIAMVYSMFWATSMFELDFFEVQSTSVHTKGRNKRGGPWILLSWWPFFLLKRWEAMPMPCPVERTRKGLKVPIQQRCIVVWYQLDLPSSSGRWRFTSRDSLLNM